MVKNKEKPIPGYASDNTEEVKKKKDQVMVILVGNVGCGKTTLSRRYADRNYVVVSRDALRSMIDGERYKFDFDLEPHVFEIETNAIEIFLEAGYNIVVDETNTSLRTRFRLLRLAEEHNVQTLIHVLPRLGRKECIDRRMKHDKRGYTRKRWEEIWDMFDKSYVEPNYKEGFDWMLREKYPQQTLGRLVRYGYRQNS